MLRADAMRSVMGALFASLTALASCTLAAKAHAAGVLGAGGKARVLHETALVVWDSASRTEHLLLSTRVSQPEQQRAAYVFTVPDEASLLPVDDAMIAAFSRLSPDVQPLSFASALTPQRASDAEQLDTCCAQFGCSQAGRAWAEGVLRGIKHVMFLPLPAPPEGAVSALSGYVHLQFATAYPMIPFSEPVDLGAPELDPPAPSKDHPPRVRTWLELGGETRSGKWEKQMDAQGALLTEPLAACFSDALLKAPRLTGDVHVLASVAPDGALEVVEDRASSRGLVSTSSCFSSLAAKQRWPRSGLQHRVQIQLHAVVAPPAAVPRVWRAFVLASQDVEPHLGRHDDPRVPPDTRLLHSFEPSAEQLAAALPEPARAALGIDVSRRWRFVVLESGADPHPPSDEVILRPLAPLPPPKPGETPLPILSLGDRPFAPPPIKPTPLWKRRRVRIGAALTATLALVALVMYGQRRSKEIISKSDGLQKISNASHQHLMGCVSSCSTSREIYW